MSQVAPEFSDSSTQPDLVLVVEDEVLIRMDLAEELRREGFDVIEAASADEARRVLTSVPGVALLITDIRMPGTMDGLGLARWVRREFPEVKVAVLSGNVNLLQPEDADIAFSKPLDMFEIMRGLRLLLSKAEHGRR